MTFLYLVKDKLPSWRENPFYYSSNATDLVANTAGKEKRLDFNMNGEHVYNRIVIQASQTVSFLPLLISHVHGCIRESVWERMSRHQLLNASGLEPF